MTSLGAIGIATTAPITLDDVTQLVLDYGGALIEYGSIRQLNLWENEDYLFIIPDTGRIIDKDYLEPDFANLILQKLGGQEKLYLVIETTLHDYDTPRRLVVNFFMHFSARWHSVIHNYDSLVYTREEFQNLGDYDIFFNANR